MSYLNIDQFWGCLSCFECFSVVFFPEFVNIFKLSQNEGRHLEVLWCGAIFRDQPEAQNIYLQNFPEVLWKPIHNHTDCIRIMNSPIHFLVFSKLKIWNDHMEFGVTHSSAPQFIQCSSPQISNFSLSVLVKLDGYLFGPLTGLIRRDIILDYNSGIFVIRLITYKSLR